VPPPAPSRSALSRSALVAGLRALGVREGAVLMVHARMSALGWVVGGSGTVVSALLEALGPEGTLVAYASWEEHVYHAGEWPAEHRAAYLAEPPVFDPATAEAARDHGRIPERVRTWPGAERSAHPEASVVAVGRLARELTADHPQQDAYGAGSPFARIVAAGGDVLLLGAPLETLTLLHHAEAVAAAPGKRTVTFEIPVATPDGVERRTYTDIDTSRGAYPYERLGLPGDEFEAIATAALEAGIGTRGAVGAATCHLFPAPELTRFATAWIEGHFT
jgi:aminoglycoside 3-N-acetyltransferase